MIAGIYIGTEKLTLFEDENIRVKSSISRIEDITKVFTDISNSFTVPADDNNNRIFKHWYNPNIVSSFDARKKVQGLITLGGLDYKLGVFRLEKVAMKHNKPSSYTISFFGNLTALKEVFDKDELSSLDLSAYDFDYNSTELTFRLFDQSSDVPFTLSSKKNYFYDSVNNLTTSNNIHYNGTNPENGFLWSDAVGSIKALRLIEAIESKYSIEFSRDFLGGYEFSNLYMMLSGGAEDESVYNEQIPFSTSDDPTINSNTILYNTTDPRNTFIDFYVTPVDKSKEYTYTVSENGTDVYSSKLYGDLYHRYTGNISTSKNLTFNISSKGIFVYSHKVIRGTKILSNLPVSYQSETNQRNIPLGDYIVSEKLPKLTVIDFISGLFKLDKLIAIVQDDGSIYVDTLNNYYRKGKVWSEFERYVDYDTIDLSRGVLNNEIEYTFKESKGYEGIGYKDANNKEYGN